jgi:hypothetical protein
VFTLTLDAPAPGAARLRLTGHLDGEAARDVLHAAADVVRCGCARLLLDLEDLTSWDADATYAVVGCTRLARWLPEGVEVVGGQRLQHDLVPAAPGGRSPSPLTRAGDSPVEALPGDTMAACHAS